MGLDQARQRGVYSILTVFILGVAVASLGVLAIGQLSWQKAQVQSLADLVALTAARQLADGPTFTEANQIAVDNGKLDSDQLSIECVINNVPYKDASICAQAITSRVTLTRTVSPLLAFFGVHDITATAEASTAPTVVGSVGSGILSLDSNQSALLNGLLSGLGGGAVNLSVAQYGTLLGSSVTVNLLKLATQLGVASVDQLLDLHVSALTLLQDALVVGNASAADNLAITGVLSALSGPLNAVNLKVGDLLAVDLSGRSDTVLNAGLGNLAQVALLKSVQSHSYTVPISVGLLNLSVTANILQAPQLFVGRKSPYKDPIVSANTAQIALDVRIKQPLNISIPLVSISALDMGLQLKVGGGVVDINDLTCRYPRANDNLKMTVVPPLVDVCIADSNSNLNSTTAGLICGSTPAEILSANIAGFNTDIGLKASTSLRGSTQSYSIDGEAPFSRSLSLSMSDTLSHALGNTSLQLSISPSLPLVGALVNTLLTTLSPVLSPVLGTVGGILDTLLNVLGVNINQVTVNVDSVDCKSVVLTK